MLDQQFTRRNSALCCLTDLDRERQGGLALTVDDLPDGVLRLTEVGGKFGDGLIASLEIVEQLHAP